MPAALPLKTTEEDLDQVSGYLRNQVGWVPLTKVRSVIASKHADNRKVEAMRFIGLLERDGENIKLSQSGHEYATGDQAERANVMRRCLKAQPLYDATLEWMHHRGKDQPTKTEVANYWHDSQPDATGGAAGNALTDAVVFFMRMVAVADLGKFVSAGKGRDTHLEMDATALQIYATGDPTSEEEPGADEQNEIPPPASPSGPSGGLMIGTGLNVNLEIHIAADAKPATVEEIFKNMRKYLIDGPDSSADGG